MKPREKAKEEAMKLLKSGAISIENKNERHTFKRKPKESEEDEVPGPNMNLKVKQSLYRNFLPGPILNALGPEEKKVTVRMLLRPYKLRGNSSSTSYWMTKIWIRTKFMQCRSPHGTVVRIRIGNPSNSS
ncbi:unnamed protein product [Schistosoma bovis]|nr:unnamed protein product [Schistosoma bovis]